jgi:hypothetical protein
MYEQKENIMAKRKFTVPPSAPPFAAEEQRRREEERRFDADGIIEKASQARLNRSIEFERLCEALGTRDPDFVWGLMAQILEAVGVYHYGEAIGFVLSVIKNQKPQDHLEAMLVAQMAVAHLAMAVH